MTRLRPIATVQRRVAEHFGIPAAILREPSRGRVRHGPSNVVTARHISAYLSHLLTGRSRVVIGRCHGGRDHTTICNSIARAKRLLADRPPLAAAVGTLAAEISRELGEPVERPLTAIEADAAAELIDEIAALRRELDVRFRKLENLAGVIVAGQAQEEAP